MGVGYGGGYRNMVFRILEKLGRIDLFELTVHHKGQSGRDFRIAHEVLKDLLLEHSIISYEDQEQS